MQTKNNSKKLALMRHIKWHLQQAIGIINKPISGNVVSKIKIKFDLENPKEDILN